MIAVRNQNRDGSEGTDEARIYGRTKHRNETFADRLGVLRSPVHHHRSTHSGLVHKHRTTGSGYGHSSEGSEPCLEAESAGKNRSENPRQLAEVEHDNYQHQSEIHRHHRGHYLRRNFRNSLDAADHYNGHNYGHNYAYQKAYPNRRSGLAGRQENRAERLDKLVRLHHAQAADQAGRSEHHSQRTIAVAEALSNHIHRPAACLTFVVATLKHNRQRTLEKLGRHTQQSTHPHPENRPRTADYQSYRDTRDIAHADSSTYGAHKRLKRCDFTLAGLLGPKRTNSRSEAPQRHRTGTDKQEQSAADQPAEKRVSADKI